MDEEKNTAQHSENQILNLTATLVVCKNKIENISIPGTSIGELSIGVGILVG